MNNDTNNERIIKSHRANPSYADHRIAKNLKLRVAEVSNIRATLGELAVNPGSPVGGVALKGLRVLPRKPAESASKFIRRLPEGRGFDIRELSKEWGIGEDTIRRHAKDMCCLKYVEVEPDEWVAVIMSPETAKHYV